MNMTFSGLCLALATIVCAIGVAHPAYRGKADDNDIKSLQSQLVELRTKLGENHPNVTSLKNRIALAEQQTGDRDPFTSEVRDTRSEPQTNLASAESTDEFSQSNSTEPIWLKSGRKAIEGIDYFRSKLDVQLDVRLDNAEFHDAMRVLSEMSNVPIDCQLDTDYSPVTIETQSSLREILRRILEPRHGTFVVQESCLTIIEEGGERWKAIRFYEMNERFTTSPESIIATINTMIVSSGITDQEFKTELIDSHLIVIASEPVQHQVEKLLYQFASLRQEN